MSNFQLGFFSYEVLNEILSSYAGYLVASLQATAAISGLAVILITIHFSSRGMRALDVASKLLGSAAAASMLYDRFAKNTNGGVAYASGGDDNNKDDDKNKDKKKDKDNKSSDNNTNNQQSNSKK